MKENLNKSTIPWKILHGVLAAAIAIFTLIPYNVVAQSGHKEPGDQGKKTRIYTVFNSSLQGREDFLSQHPDAEIIEDNEVMEILKQKCKEVEFVGGTRPGKEVIENIRAQKEKLDGLLCLGSPPDELISIGLPMVAVYRLWGQWFPLSYHYNDLKGKKVVTAVLPVLPDKDRSVYLSRIDDIAGKIKLIEAISKMKELRVLVITDKPPLGAWEPYDFQIEKSREKYEKVFVDNLKETFGAFLVPIPQKDLFEKMQVQDECEAKEITKKWMDEAWGIRGTNEAQILRSAKLYLAMKELMAEHNCGAIATEGYGWHSGSGVSPDLPEQGLASTQLNTDGIVAVGETLLNSLITQQLGYNFTGSTGVDGDYLIDFFNDIAVVMHCEATFKPYGDREDSPYVIANPWVFKDFGGNTVTVLLPIGVPVTVAKIDMNSKKIAVFTGESVSGEELFQYWNDISCRTKVAIKTNAKALHENRDWKTFSHHVVAFFGDYRQEFLDLATLIGFEAIECDKNR